MRQMLRGEVKNTNQFNRFLFCFAIYFSINFLCTTNNVKYFSNSWA